jgi:rubrerythrin
MALESAAELYVHAIAIEREAAERYAEFAERMAKQDNYKVAAFFRMLSAFEAKHLDALKRRTAEVELPPLTSDYSWLDEGPPETAARELIFRLMTQRQALSIALHNEKRARAFFEHAARTATDPAVRALAKEMAAEEAEHISLIERMLDRTLDPRQRPLPAGSYPEATMTSTTLQR